MSSSIATEEEDDDSAFFETFDRIPSSVSFDFNVASSSSDSDEDDSRLSFASAIATPSLLRRTFDDVVIDEEEEEEEEEDEGKGGVDYSIWMAEPMSIEERRQRLLKGMGISLSRSSFCTVSPRSNGRLSNCGPLPSALSDAVCSDTQTRPTPSVFSRSRSDVGVFGGGRNSTPSSPALVRAPSAPPSFCHPMSDDDLFTDLKNGNPNCRRTASLRIRKGSAGGGSGADNLPQRGNITRRSDTVALYTIKNLDTGKEFVINLENGTWNSKLSDLQTGNQLTMDEFERSVGYSPIVKELMRRENVIGLSSNGNGNGSGNQQSSMKRAGKKKGVKWLKNIKGVASSVTGHMLEKEGSRSNSSVSGKCNSSLSSSHSDWMKVHMRGKPFKELTGMYMSQEINAHQGSIWCMRFSPDALFMASAGEDRVVHVWQVLECDSVSSSQRPIDDQNSTYLPPVVNGSLDGSTSADVSQSQRLKRGKTFSSKRKNSIPDYVVVPETIFSLSEKPFCSFQGHLDDVLDLSWSKSQYLLSSSMDKTVRLWDMETKTCLKLFAHNDYVTCIQFNPVDDRYFISGSLDAKVRIWSIPDRQVVDWNDLHEMVTAACYTPDGQGALVGSHRGTCRLYSMSDSKLSQTAQLDLHYKKKKSQAKKITGFQFSPGNPSEVLITSADSQIRVVTGVDLIHKFRGFRNTSSQISATYSPDGNYVVCASEDSHVYLWKRGDSHSVRSHGKGKTWVTTHAHENFHCKDVSVAIPWPGSSRHEPPSIPSSSSSSTRFNRSQHTTSPDSQAPSASLVSSPEDPFANSRSHCPPLPKRTSPDQTMARTDEENSGHSRSGSNISSSISSGSSSWLWSGPLSSISGFSLPSSALSSRWYTGGSNRVSASPAATAWGLVIVTAGLGGEIRVYQNFGLPLRLSR